MSEHPAIQNLREHQQQLDADGIMVGVSRQAVAETLTEIGRLRAELSYTKNAVDKFKVYGARGLVEDIAILTQELSDSRAVLAEMDKLVAGLRERNAEAVQCLKDCVLLLEITEKIRNPSWDKSATPSSVIGYARAAIASAEPAAKPDFPPESFA